MGGRPLRGVAPGDVITYLDTTRGPRVIPQQGPLAGSILVPVPWLSVESGVYELELDNGGPRMRWTPYQEAKAA